MIICYTVLEIWRVTDVVVIFHLRHFFALLHLLHQPKNKSFIKINNKKEKKHLEISSFPEKCYVTDVIVIFHFGLFFALLPPNNPKSQNFKKMKTIHGDFTRVPKTMIR